MKIRMLQGMAGHDFAWHAGEVVEVDDRLGAALADGVRAVPADAAERVTPRRGGRRIETAAVEGRETR